MDDEILKGFLRIGALVGGCSLVMLFMLPADSPEFVVSVCNALIGAALIAGVVIVSRWMRRL